MRSIDQIDQRREQSFDRAAQKREDAERLRRVGQLDADLRRIQAEDDALMRAFPTALDADGRPVAWRL